MSKSKSLIAIFLIIGITIFIGVFASEWQSKESEEELIVLDSDSEIEPGRPAVYERLDTPHRADFSGLDPYIVGLRLYMAGMVEFEDFLLDLQTLLINHGIAIPVSERGQFSLMDVGEDSRYAIVVQRDRDSTIAVLFVVDTIGSAPYKVTPVYWGSYFFGEVNDDGDILITRLDQTITRIPRGELDVD